MTALLQTVHRQDGRSAFSFSEQKVKLSGRSGADFILFLIQADELLGAYRSLMSIVKSLSFTNTTFLSDCQQLVEFLNQPDLTHPPDWRMKCFTQIFHNSTLHQQARIFKIDTEGKTPLPIA